jgi:hypothetical protein
MRVGGVGKNNRGWRLSHREMRDGELVPVVKFTGALAVKFTGGVLYTVLCCS